jgi:hypothetical protein
LDVIDRDKPRRFAAFNQGAQVGFFDVIEHGWKLLDRNRGKG